MQQRVVILCVGIAIQSAGFTPAAEGQIERTVTFSQARQDRVIPKWENGRLLVWHPKESFVQAHDSSGRQVAEVAVRIDGAATIEVQDVAAAPDGRLVVSGGAIDSSGIATGFLLYARPDGAVASVTKTGPYLPRRVCVASDGNTWALGWSRVDEMTPHPTEDVVRVYDGGGRFLFSALPATDFPRFTAASRSERSFNHPAAFSDIASGRNRVGLYSLSAGEYIELSLTGQVLGRWKTAHPAGHQAYIGLALLGTESAYVHVGPSGAPPVIGKLDRTANAWKPPESQMPAALIHGADGDRLVVSTRPPEFVWLRAP